MYDRRTHLFAPKNNFIFFFSIPSQRTLGENEPSSELLPDGWNENGSSYALRYICNGKLYILLGNVANDTLIVNILVNIFCSVGFLRDPKIKFLFHQTSESLEVSNIAFILKDTVKSLKGSLVELVPNIDTVVGDLKKNLLEPLKTKTETTSTAETQTGPVPFDSSGFLGMFPPLRVSRNDRERMYVECRFRSLVAKIPNDFCF